jgi:hypothetical protein
VKQRHLGLALLALAVLTTSCAQSASAGGISTQAYPSNASVSAEFAFVLRYVGDFPVERAEVVIDGEARAMVEVDPSDSNHTNGKDYSLKTRLPEGSHVYYFLLVDANGTEYRSASGIVFVDPVLEWGHFDVALAVLLFMVPLAYGLFLVRRAAKALERVARRLDAREASEPEDAGVTPPSNPPGRG